ncbi:MAG: hypothetical protein DBY34_10385 [Oscillospiraceae bacterium]|nr:MAG: hypothetical protein DBY34_10385 [Oscillospiraceae bacterium]
MQTQAGDGKKFPPPGFSLFYAIFQLSGIYFFIINHPVQKHKYRQNNCVFPSICYTEDIGIPPDFSTYKKE